MTCAEVRAERARLEGVIEAAEGALGALPGRCMHDETTTQAIAHRGAWVDVVVCAACRTYIGPVDAPHG